MLAFIHERVCGNSNALKSSIQKLIEKNKKHHSLERVWGDILNLLEDEFPLPIQTSVYHLCALLKNCQVVLLVKSLIYPPEDLPHSYTCQVSPLLLN